MERDGRCDWCQQLVRPNESRTVHDRLLFHTLPLRFEESCLEQYRKYVRYIKETVQ